MKQAKKQNKSAHALFWSLLKEVPGYKDSYKDVIKEGIVHQYSGGKTTSLSEMYKRFPAQYCEMIESLKGDYWQKRERYESSWDRSAKRVIAVICSYVDKFNYEFTSPSAKVQYVKSIACRAANCESFNKIPESRLSAIYNFYCEKNRVNIVGNPELDHMVSKN